MKRLVWLSVLLLLSACATVPKTPSPASSGVSVLVPGEGYIGDCFSGFFRPAQEFVADKSMRAWIFVDPGDETADIRFEGRYVRLKRTSSTFDDKAQRGRSVYAATAPKLWVGLDFEVTDIADGVEWYKGALEIKADGGSETIAVKGMGACGGE